MNRISLAVALMGLLVLPILADSTPVQTAEPQLLQAKEAAELKGAERAAALSAASLATRELKTKLVLLYLDESEVPESDSDDVRQAITDVEDNYEDSVFLTYMAADFESKEGGIISAKHTGVSDIAQLEFLFQIPLDTLFIGNKDDLEGGLITKMLEDMASSAEPQRDARRAEAEAIAGTLKTQMRAQFAKTGIAPKAGDKSVEEALEPCEGEHVDRASYNYDSYSATGDCKDDCATWTIYMKDEADGVLVYRFIYMTGSGTFVWIDEGRLSSRKATAEAVAGTCKTNIRAHYAKTGTLPGKGNDFLDDLFTKAATCESIRHVRYKEKDKDNFVISIEMTNPDDGIYVYEVAVITGRSKGFWTKYGKASIDLTVKEGRREYAEKTAQKVMEQLVELFNDTDIKPRKDSQKVEGIIEKTSTSEVIKSVSYEPIKDDSKDLGTITIIMVDDSDGTLTYSFDFTQDSGTASWKD